MSELPVIFIFDLDNTIIGDLGGVSSYDDLIKFIQYACKNNKLSDKLCKKQLSSYAPKQMIEALRPGFIEFVKNIKKYYPTAELFIYSYGTKLHVDRSIVFIENCVGEKVFNRPLFSRTECFLDENNKNMKNISYHLSTMINTLKPRYRALQKKEIDPITLMKDRIIFIDDSNVVWDMSNKHIHCPEFDYYQICSVDDTMLRLMYKEDLIQKFIVNNKTLPLYADYDTDKSENFDEFKMRYHLFMANMYQKFLPTNKNALNDVFFYKFEKALRPYGNQQKPFTDEHIKKIQKMVNQ